MPTWAEAPDNVGDWTAWLWWLWYLALALFGLFVAARRDLRRALLRLVAPRLRPRPFRWARRLLFDRILWLAVGTLSVFIVFLLFGSVAMYFLERGVNDKFKTLEEASHSTLIYLFSGMEDRTPQTVWGWRCYGLLALTGLGLTAYFTGYFVSEILTRGRGTMERDAARQSFLIIGWNPRTRQVIDELFRAFEVGMERHLITVLAEERVDTSTVADLDSRGVTFVSGDPFDKKVLERIGAHQARSVILLANHKYHDPDGHSAMTVLALTGLFNDAGVLPGHRPRVCVEVVNHRKMALIRDAGAHETICHEDFGLGVLAQSAMVSSICEVYQELLSYAPATNAFHIVRSPPQGDGGAGDLPLDIWQRLLEGKSFAEAADVFTRGRDVRNPVILVGLRRGGRILVNPRDPLRLQRGDDLLVIAYGFPSLEHLRRLL